MNNKRKYTYSSNGNRAFMFTVILAAVLSTALISFLGLSSLSLAGLIIMVIVGVTLGSYFEKVISDAEESMLIKIKLETQNSTKNE